MKLKTKRTLGLFTFLIPSVLLLVSATIVTSRPSCNIKLSLQDSNEFKGLPDDLDIETIVFLNLDSAEVAADRPGVRQERAEWNTKNLHNIWVPKSNKQLEETAPSYPFNYIIGRRSELESYKKKGYKYVFDYAPFVEAQNGIRKTNSNYTVKFPVYIRNLENGDIYILGHLADNFVYYYKNIIKKHLLKKVKSKYKSKLK